MVEQEAIEMVRQQVAAGKTDAQIRPILESAGYSRAEVMEILLHAKTHSPGGSPHEAAPPRMAAQG